MNLVLSKCKAIEPAALVALYDHRDSGAVTIDDATGDIFRANVAGADFLPFITASAKTSGELSGCNHAIVHARTDRSDSAALGAVTAKMFGASGCGVVLEVSTSPIEGRSLGVIVHALRSDVWLSMMDSNAYAGVSTWFKEFLMLTYDDARRLASCSAREDVPDVLEKKCAHLLDVILPRTIENRLALRLLCEAWRMTDGAASKVLNGITISAPQKPSDWLAPFGAGKPESVAALMGEAKTDASNLLAAVSRENKEGIAKCVDVFIKQEQSKHPAREGAL